MSLVELARYYTSMEAEINRTRLGSHGIESVVFDGTMNIIDGANLQSRLMILAEDFEDAQKILSTDAVDLNLDSLDDPSAADDKQDQN